MTAPAMARTDERAVYGLRITGLAGVAELEQVGTSAGFEVAVDVRQSTGTPPPVAPVDGSRGVMLLPDGRYLALDRAASTATFYGPPLRPDELAHPYLGAVASTFNRWAGRETFHAGAFVAGGRAWVVPGRKEAGKSSLMAALAARGVPVLCDDAVVTDGSHVYAGPRCIDLRAALPRVSLPTTPARSGSRLRVPLPPAPSRVPLGGWVFLAWGGTAMDPVGAHALLRRLAVGRSVRGLPSDPSVLLHLAARPAWDHSRPKDWAALDEAVDLLVSTVSGSRPTEDAA